MKANNEKNKIDGSYCPVIKCRWKSYRHYRLILWAWMMNEVTTIFTPTEVSHNGFYAHAAIQALAVIFIGLPLAYSEICLGQYTNCNIFTMWDFCPLFRNCGYAIYYTIFTKAIYLLVLTSWHLIYTFYAAMDNPPWLNCNEFGDAKCMVKRVNVSIFQHCLEAQFLFEDDCGMQTASSCFYEREIGSNCTAKNPHCYRPWKTIIAVNVVSISIYIFSIKREKVIQIIVKVFAFYVCFTILVLFGISLSTSGTWYASKITLNWTSYNFYSCFNTVSRGFLSVGTGSGILLYLSRDVPFRSPATMTAISTCLFSYLVSFMFALIAFSGIKTMSYYHGEEENVIEIGSSLFFPIFASLSEIMTYFDPLPIWGFVWFSVGFLSLYLNFWIIYLFLQESLLNSCNIAQRYPKVSSMFLMLIIMFCTLPFLCSDLTAILTDASEIMLTFNSFLQSLATYWIYGIHNHNVDIIFMIGIKANYFWKITWLLNPLFILCILYRGWDILQIHDFQDAYYLQSLGMTLDVLMLYVILGIYALIVIIGLIVQMLKYCAENRFREIVSPAYNWGPLDRILFRSRNMFLPEIMTREFLYRQVRIRGYQKRKKVVAKSKIEKQSSVVSVGEANWSVLTSN